MAQLQYCCVRQNTHKAYGPTTTTFCRQDVRNTKFYMLIVDNWPHKPAGHELTTH